MTKWKMPHVIKIYEALGVIGDERIILEEDKAEVYSSEGNKKYDVVYSENDNAIMANDNGSYWVGYLGYPSIAYLMSIGKLALKGEYAEALKEVEWKKINAANKNDFDKTQHEVDQMLEKKGINLDEFYLYLAEINSRISELDLNMLGGKVKPPREASK